MTGLSLDQKRAITANLLEAGATRPCPRCGGEEFELLDGYIMEFTQSQLRNMVVGSQNRFTTVASVCGRCGFLAQHALPQLA
jgi:ribosomal protein S27AE